MKIFESTCNTRFLLENSTRYIRSDVPTSVSPREREWLLQNGVTTVLDLRTEEERNHRHCPLMEDSRFLYETFPVAGGGAVPRSVDEVARSYIAMVDTAFECMIAGMLKSPSGILYFCSAGKDRTGVVSAVLLKELGMPTSYIVADYMKSAHNLAPWLAAYARQDPTLDLAVITPQPRYIEALLRWYTEGRR